MPQKNLDMGISLTTLTEKCGGKLHSNVESAAIGICPFDQPIAEHLTFTREGDQQRLTRALQKISIKLAAVLIRSTIDPKALPTHFNYIVCNEPLNALLELVPLFHAPQSITPGISPKADIHPSAKLGREVFIAPYAVIGADCEIGDNVVIHPHVTLYPNVKVGDGCILHAGAVIREDSVLGKCCVIQPGAIIGADGFGYVPDPKMGLRPVPQVGRVEMAERVDVGANACVDRATFGVTRIGTSSKLDNLVQVGHNVQIGKYTAICGQTGIAGSCEIGNNVVLGGSVGVGDHIKISDNIRVAARAGVTKALVTPGDYGGFPAIDVKTWRRQVAALTRLERSRSKAAQHTETDENDDK